MSTVDAVGELILICRVDVISCYDLLRVACLLCLPFGRCPRPPSLLYPQLIILPEEINVRRIKWASSFSIQASDLLHWSLPLQLPSIDALGRKMGEGKAGKTKENNGRRGQLDICVPGIES